MAHDTEHQPNPSIRWLHSEFPYDDLNGKRVFATFTQSPDALGQYEGTGEIRVLENPEGMLAIDLVFTRRESYDKFTDILFHLSQRQLPHLRKAPADATYDFQYEGILSSDDSP